MPSAIWSGSISFGLVSVPVKMVTATRSQDVRFNQLEEGTGARIRYRKVSEATGDEVPSERIVKGFEISSGQYVVVEDDEMEAFSPKATRMIEIEDFVDLEDIDPIYFERPYYLVPDKAAAKPYRLLLATMEEMGKVAVGRVVLRAKEHLVAIRPLGDALCIETMRYADEVVPVDRLEGLPEEDVEPSQRELDMARQLVETLSTEFEPDKYHDTYREQVMDLIHKKAEGEEIVAEPLVEEPAKVVDLMAALEASLARAGAGSGDGTERRSRKAAAQKPGGRKAAKKKAPARKSGSGKKAPAKARKSA